MGLEIERKFLVTASSWRAGASGVFYRQGYLCADQERTVRVRLAGSRAFLTVKGASSGSTRSEFEYPLPVEDAVQMLDELCLKPLIEKERYRVDHAGLTWEIDVFSGENAGLVLAEVELASPDQQIELPPWAGREVTSDPRYYNACLIRNPYANWAEQEENLTEI